MNAKTMLAVLLGAAAAAWSTTASAQVPPDIAAANRAIGKTTDVAGTAKLYGPLAETPPYREAAITRDLAYGPDPRNRLDVFRPAAAPRGRLPVVIHLSGGENLRTMHAPNAEGFYDNVMLWAVKHGMVGVNTDRHLDRGAPWGAGAKDVGLMVKWVRENIARYGGDPDRIFFVAHAYGGTDVSTYLAHKEFWTGPTPGVAGAAFIGAPFNLAPLIMPRAGRSANPMFDPAHSDLEGLKALDLPLFISLGEYDPDSTLASDQALRQALCARRCPTFVVFKDHQHISTMFSFNTADESVSGPVLAWIRSVPK
jgi:triacylglycerol lipase